MHHLHAGVKVMFDGITYSVIGFRERERHVSIPRGAAGDWGVMASVSGKNKGKGGFVDSVSVWYCHSTRYFFYLAL